MRALITGTAGFIGFHLARRLLGHGHQVLGYDGMTRFYDEGLKARRHAILKENPAFLACEAMLEDAERLLREAEAFAPEIIVHLAGQAGVRGLLDRPRLYVDSNVVGTLNVLEAARRVQPRHLLVASTSSVYGASEEMPFAETQKADFQLSVYAATKKASESLAHAYAHLFGLATTCFRFFTVYGPWERPDLAPFLFADAMLRGKPIDVYNRGEMFRDFTYVEDLVRAVHLLIDAPPPPLGDRPIAVPGDSLSPVAPFRIVNIGNSEKVRLDDFIAALEAELGVAAIRNEEAMQPGDVIATWADCSLLEQLTGYRPATSLAEGVARFADWFREYKGGR